MNLESKLRTMVVLLLLIISTTSFTPMMEDRSTNSVEGARSTVDIEIEYVDEIDTSMLFSPIEFNGRLYAGGMWSGEIYRSDGNGDNWVSVLDTGERNIRGSAIFNDELYFGTNDDEARIFRSSDGTSWEQVYNSSYGGISLHSMIVRDGYLYAGTISPAKIIRTNDGENWTIVHNSTFQETSFIRAYGDTYFASFYNSGEDSITFFNSSDGLNWQHLSVLSENCGACPSVLYNDTYFFSTRDEARVYSTRDFEVFKMVHDVPGTAIEIESMDVYNNRIWVGVSGGEFGKGEIYYSDDGDNWNKVSLAGLGFQPMKITTIFYFGKDDSIYFATGEHWNPPNYPARIFRLVMEKLPEADVYVDNTGSDVEGNGTKHNPYRSLDLSFAEATEGDLVVVGSGSYKQDANISKSLDMESEPGKITFDGKIEINPSADVTMRDMNIDFLPSEDQMNRLIIEGEVTLVDCTIRTIDLLSIYVGYRNMTPLENAEVTVYQNGELIIDQYETGSDGWIREVKIISGTYLPNGILESHPVDIHVEYEGLKREISGFDVTSSDFIEIKYGYETDIGISDASSLSRAEVYQNGTADLSLILQNPYPFDENSILSIYYRSSNGDPFLYYQRDLIIVSEDSLDLNRKLYFNTSGQITVIVTLDPIGSVDLNPIDNEIEFEIIVKQKVIEVLLDESEIFPGEMLEGEVYYLGDAEEAVISIHEGVDSILEEKIPLVDITQTEIPGIDIVPDRMCRFQLRVPDLIKDTDLILIVRIQDLSYYTQFRILGAPSLEMKVNKDQVYADEEITISIEYIGRQVMVNLEITDNNGGIFYSNSQATSGSPDLMIPGSGNITYQICEFNVYIPRNTVIGKYNVHSWIAGVPSISNTTTFYVSPGISLIEKLYIVSVDLDDVETNSGIGTVRIKIGNSFAVEKELTLALQMMVNLTPLMPVLKTINIAASIEETYTLDIDISDIMGLGEIKWQVMLLEKLPSNGGFGVCFMEGRLVQ